MKQIYKTLDGIYSNSSLRKTIVPLFIGDPGVGKTKIIEQFAKDKGVNLVELITSQMSPFEISGIAMPDKKTRQMTYFNFDKLENLKDGDVLFFDELLNGNPVVLNACLTILEQRRFISGKSLPDVMIIAAANPKGQSPLTPQIKERFVWYKIEFDRKMWVDYMFKKYMMPKVIVHKLCDLIEFEDFTGNNFNSPRSLDKATNMMIHSIPTPYNGAIEPILNTLIENKLKDKVVLSEELELESNEKISWLKLIQVSKGINIKPEVETIHPEQPLYDVILKDWRGRGVGEVNLIADIADVSYDRALKMLNALPNVYIKHKVNEGEAASIKQRLEVNGATVEIKLSKN